MAELNSNYTFAAYREDIKNTFALNVAKSIISMSDYRLLGNCYNLLYLYGKKGSGKTHLVQAMAHEFQKKGFKVTYTTCEEFTSEMTTMYNSSCWKRKNEAFRAKYHKADVLIVEDIENLKEPGTVIELFYLVLPELIKNNKKLLITANKPFHELQNLDKKDKEIFSLEKWLLMSI
jgi:chromosomal replication initiator protein